MAYTEIDDPGLFFNTVLYTGTGSSQNITVGFQPDFTWIKTRTGNSHEHKFTDVIRGVGKGLASDGAGAEFVDAQGLTAFGSNGYTIGTDTYYNTNTNTYVSWNWKAGTSFSNDASATSIGSLDSTGSVSADSGFSIVSWTGDGNAATIKHGLSTKPDVIILKNRSITENWPVYHHKVSSAPETDYIHLDNYNAAGDYPIWNDVEPTTSVFSVGGYDGTNGDGNSLIAYCFADVKGYSKFGSYAGNGDDSGPMIWTGFRPAFVMVKVYAGGTGDWQIYDNKRAGYNAANYRLKPSSSAAEATDEPIDILSNGFKLRNDGGSFNASGDDYIYMAFAEAPFVNSNGVPCNAR